MRYRPGPLGIRMTVTLSLVLRDESMGGALEVIPIRPAQVLEYWPISEPVRDGLDGELAERNDCAFREFEIVKWNDSKRHTASAMDRLNCHPL
jgi:hypothetical protein